MKKTLPPLLAEWVGRRRRLDMRFGTCPKLEACSKIKTARLNRARICCRDPESLESICARCEEIQESKEEKQALAV